MEMTIVELYEKEGLLWYPHQQDFMGDKESVVLVRYLTGDYDTFKWPLDTSFRSVEKQWEQITRAMYDARECGDIPSDTGVVVLPDGTTLEI